MKDTCLVKDLSVKDLFIFYQISERSSLVLLYIVYLVSLIPNHPSSFLAFVSHIPNTETNRSVPYKSVLMLNYLNSRFTIRCKACLTHRLSRLKPRFDLRCYNCRQLEPTRTDDNPRTSSDEERVEAAGKIEFLPSTPLVKPHSSSSRSETKPMEPESTPVKATQARSSTMKEKKKRPNSETETTPSKRVKKEDPEEKVVKLGKEKKRPNSETEMTLSKRVNKEDPEEKVKRKRRRRSGSRRKTQRRKWSNWARMRYIRLADAVK